jgi:hypothetical protein
MVHGRKSQSDKAGPARPFQLRKACITHVRLEGIHCDMLTRRDQTACVRGHSSSVQRRGKNCHMPIRSLACALVDGSCRGCKSVFFTPTPVWRHYLAITPSNRSSVIICTKPGENFKSVSMAMSLFVWLTWYPVGSGQVGLADADYEGSAMQERPSPLRAAERYAA